MLSFCYIVFEEEKSVSFKTVTIYSVFTLLME
jgi:hypothetical protein